MSIDDLRKACLILSQANYTSIEYWERQPIWKLSKYMELTAELADKSRFK